MKGHGKADLLKSKLPRKSRHMNITIQFNRSKFKSRLFEAVKFTSKYVPAVLLDVKLDPQDYVPPKHGLKSVDYRSWICAKRPYPIFGAIYHPNRLELTMLSINPLFYWQTQSVFKDLLMDFIF